MTDTPSDAHADDFLDGDAYAAPDTAWAQQPAEAGASATRPPRRGPTGARTAGWLAVGVVVGAVTVAALHSSTSTSTLPAGNPAAATGTLPGGQSAPNGGTGFTGRGFAGPGARAGEQHLVATLSAVGTDSITVTTSSGTATYPIEVSTLLVKDGQRVSSLTALHKGDAVVVHVYRLNGSAHLEMVLDGQPAGGFGGPSGTGTATTT